MADKVEKSPKFWERMRSTFLLCFDAADRFAWETVQWQRSVASPVYLMILNGIFWLCAFYLHREWQIGSLLTVAAILSITELWRVAILLSQCSLRRGTQRLNSQWEDFRQSSLGAQIVQFVQFIITLAPLRFLLSPVTYEIQHLICDKFDHVLLCILCVSGARHLQLNHAEQAAWLAYAAAATCALGPPWRHHGVTESILFACRTAVSAVALWLYNGFVAPLIALVVACWIFIRYYIFFEWVPPLIERIKRGIAAVKYFIRVKITQPISDFVGRCVARIVRIYTRIKDFLVYWFGGYWIAPLRHWIREQWLLPVGVHISRFKICVIYVVCLHWVAPLRAYLKLNVFDPSLAALLRLLAAIKVLCSRALRLAIYIFLGYWLVDLSRFLYKQLKIFARYSYRNWLVPSYYQCCIWKDLLIAHVKENILAPLIQLAKLCVKKFALWLQHSVLQPLLYSMYVAVADLCILAHKTVILPAWLVLEVHARRMKLYVWVQYLDPLLRWIYSKLPAQDDSDLCEFMPSHQFTSTRASASPRSESDDNELYDDLLPEQPAPTVNPARYRRTKTRHIENPSTSGRGTPLRTGTPTGSAVGSSARSSGLFESSTSAAGGSTAPEGDDQDLDDFVHGLQFTSRATKDSDSSDDEFSLRRVVRKRARRKAHADPSAAQTRLQPVNPTNSDQSHQTASTPLLDRTLDATETSVSSVEHSSEKRQQESRPLRAVQRKVEPTAVSGTVPAAKAVQPDALGSLTVPDDRKSISPESMSQPSWSDTLLAAYKKSNKPAGNRPPPIARDAQRVKVPEQAVGTLPKEDHDFEILDKDELDHLY